MVVYFTEVEIYRRANALVETGEYARGLKLYLKLEEMYPEDWRYSNMVGYCYTQLKKYEIGREKFQSSLLKNGLASTIYNNLAWSYNEEENYEQAFRHLKLIVNQFPNDPFLFFNLGNAYYGLEKYEEALNAFEKSLSLNRYFYDCYFSLGLCFYHIEKYEEAEKYFELALDKKVGSIDDIYYFLSKCYLLNHRYEKHLESVDVLLDLNEEDIEILLDRVATLMILKRWKEAIEDLDFILFLDEENEEAIQLLSYIEQKRSIK